MIVYINSVVTNRQGYNKVGISKFNR